MLSLAKHLYFSRLILHLIVFLLPVAVAFSQVQPHQDKNFTLQDNTLNGTTHDYEARDYIELKPGFQYSAQPGKWLHLGINKNLVLPVDYTASLFSDADIDNRQINTSLPVGAIPGSASVSPTGVATYTTPIYVPPGTAGMQPNLSIVYNSQGGNGLLGMGWSLGGLSAITRTGKTIYHDGKVEPVNLDDQDRFVLDGNRLILTSGTYGYNNATYATEAETFSRITSNGFVSNGPLYFTVETKSGLTMRYGYTDDARLQETVTDPVLAWFIDKISDNYGNYMLFEYSKDGDGFRIKEIKYTGNSNQNPYNNIKFYYEKRDDVNKIFIAGKAVNNNLLLFKIEVVCEGSIVKKYKFSYGLNMFSMLKEIEEIGNGNTSLNTTMFLYGDNGGFSNQTVSDVPLNNYDYIPGDFNGDGKEDLVSMNFQMFVGKHKKYIGTPTLYINDGNNNFTPYSITANIPTPFFAFSPENDKNTEKWRSIAFKELERLGVAFITNMDFNGDGKSDLLLGQSDYQNIDGVAYTAYLSTGTDFIKQDNSGFMPYYMLPNTGDFDGNGTLDLLYYRPFNGIGGIYYYDIDVNEMIELKFCGLIENELTENVRDYPIDIDGDGKTELLTLINGGNTVIQKIHVQDNICLPDMTAITVPFTVEQSNPIGSPAYEDSVFIADFNGDAKTDLLVYDDDGPEWKIHYATGSDFYIVDAPNLGDLTSSKELFVVDIDGNGLSDIIKIEREDICGNNDGVRIVFYLSNGINFFPPMVHCFNYPPISSTGTPQWVLGDFNGDGNMDIGLKDNNAFTIHFFTTEDKTFLLQKVSDGFNFKTTFEYQSLSEGGTFYTKSNTVTYPLMDFQGPLYAVSSITVPDGIGGDVTTNYSYEGALIHKQGKGFLGFSKVTQVNDATVITTVTRYSLLTPPSLPPSPYPEPVYNMLPSSIQVFSPDNQLVSNTIFANSAKQYDVDLKRYFPYTSEATILDFLKDRTTSSTTNYDSDGNLTQRVTANYSGAPVGEVILSDDDLIETETVEYTNFSSNGSHLPTYPQNVDVTRTRDLPSFSVSLTYSYNNNGRIEEEIKFSNLADITKQITTTYSYDNNTGNLLLATASASGLDDRTTSYEYDTKGRFATKITNPLNQKSEIQYDPAWGKPLMQKGIDGLVTTYGYDGFGRLNKMKTPDGLETTYEKEWFSGNGSHAIVLDKVTPDGAPSVKTGHDIYGRTVATITDGFDGKEIISFRVFNNKGQVSITSLPVFTGGTPVTTTHTYDDFGRVTSELNSACNCTTSYAYTGTGGIYTVSVTNPANQTSSTTTDASGKVVSATDNGGTLLYTYFSNGQTKDIKFSGQNDAISSMTYDDRGFQTTLDDANAGLMAYEYNAYGELITQTDAQGNKYEMTYNKLGQMITREHPVEGITTWQYYPTGTAINKPRIITAPNTNRQTFFYDNLGRLSTLTETIDGNNYSTSYAYNNFGYISEISYPSGFSVKREYDNKGYLQYVRNKSDNTVIWEGTEMNALGQYTKYIQGNGFTSVKTFNDLGMSTSITAGTNSPDFNNLQNLSLNWNLTTGNLTSRTDNIKTPALSEAFTYDNLNRLTSVQVTNQPALTMNYQGNGNINYKEDLGSYVYSSTQLNAVEKIMCGDVPYAPQQDITYTPFNKTATVTEGNYELTYSYGPDQQRKKSVLINTSTGTIERKIIYAGDYEEITAASGNTYKVHYIAGGSGLTAIYVAPPSGGGGALYYVYTDHLGSILKLVHGSGTIVYENNFDAWGRQRNPDDLTYNIPLGGGVGAFGWLMRGFTGHEHLPEFGLINMNGRMYDPVIGRVLSPDYEVQYPFSTQSHNRYSYAYNNPLLYIDPTGGQFYQYTLYQQGHMPTSWIESEEPSSQQYQYNSSYNIDYISQSGISYATGIPDASIADLLYQEAYNKALYELYLEYNYVPLPKLNVTTINTGAQFLESRLPEVIASSDPNYTGYDPNMQEQINLRGPLKNFQRIGTETGILYPVDPTWTVEFRNPAIFDPMRPLLGSGESTWGYPDPEQRNLVLYANPKQVEQLETINRATNQYFYRWNPNPLSNEWYYGSIPANPYIIWPR